MIVAMGLIGCTAPDLTETTAQQPLQSDGVVTYRFTGSLPQQGEYCTKPYWMHDTLCGRSFRGYMTVPETPTYADEASGYFTYQAYGPPYGMVLHVDGEAPRRLPYVYLYAFNDFPDFFGENTTIDYFEVGAAAANSQDGFSVHFVDHTASTLDGATTDPSPFTNDPPQPTSACEYGLGGCPIVTGDAWADFKSLVISFERSPVVQPVPYDVYENPYWVADHEWLDAAHTSLRFAGTIYDSSYRFRGSTCDVWVAFDEGDSTSRSVFDRLHHDGNGQTQTSIDLAVGAANPARELKAVNITCTFADPDGTVVENTFINYGF